MLLQPGDKLWSVYFIVIKGSSLAVGERGTGGVPGVGLCYDSEIVTEDISL